MSEQTNDDTIKYDPHRIMTTASPSAYHRKLAEAQDAVQMIYEHPEQPLEVQTWATNAIDALAVLASEGVVDPEQLRRYYAGQAEECDRLTAKVERLEDTITKLTDDRARMLLEADEFRLKVERLEAENEILRRDASPETTAALAAIRAEKEPECSPPSS